MYVEQLVENHHVFATVAAELGNQNLFLKINYNHHKHSKTHHFTDVRLICSNTWFCNTLVDSTCSKNHLTLLLKFF